MMTSTFSIRGLLRTFIISILSLSLGACFDANKGICSIHGGNKGNQCDSSNTQIVTDSTKHWVPSAAGQVVTYSLLNHLGLPIINQTINLTIEGQASFSLEQSSALKMSDPSLNQRLTVQTDNKGEFSVSIQSMRTGEFTLNIFIGNELIMSDVYLTSNVNQQGLPAIAVSRLSVIGDTHPVIVDVAMATNVAQLMAYDEFGNPFPTIDSAYFALAVEHPDDDILPTISSVPDQKDRVQILVSVDANATTIPQDNRLTVSYRPISDDGNGVETQLALTFETLPVEVGELADLISSDLDSVESSKSQLELVRDQTGTVVGARVYNPTTQQVSEVKSVQPAPESKSELVNALPNTVAIDPNASTTHVTQFEVVVSDSEGNKVSSTVNSVIEYDDGLGGTQTATVKTSVTESARFDLLSGVDTDSFALLDSLTGRIEETEITLPDGTVNKASTFTSSQADGSVITAQQNVSTDGTVDSLNGELTGAIERVAVSQTDSHGLLLQQQTLTSGEDAQGNQVASTTHFQASGALEIEGEVVSGAVNQSTVKVKDSSGTETSQQLATVRPSGGGDLIVTPPITTIVPVGVDKANIATQNVPINGNATPETVNALALVFEQNYGIDFDAWDINKRVVPYIMRDVMDYDAMLTMLKNKNDGSLKSFMQNYPMSSTNGFITVLTVAGQHKTLVMTGNINDETKKELVFDSRPKEWRFIANFLADANGARYPQNILISLEDGRTYLIRAGNIFDLTSTANFSTAGLAPDYLGTDGDGNTFLKHVTSMGFSAANNLFYVKYSAAIFLLQAPGDDKKILCLETEGQDLGQCRKLNVLNDGSVVWYELFNQTEALESKALSITVEGEYGNKVFALNDKGTYYLHGYTEYYPDIQVSKYNFERGSITGDISWVRTGDKIYITADNPIAYNQNKASINLDAYKVVGKAYNYVLPAHFSTIDSTIDGMVRFVANNGEGIYLESREPTFEYSTNAGYVSVNHNYPTIIMNDENHFSKQLAYFTAVRRNNMVGTSNNNEKLMVLNSSDSNEINPEQVNVSYSNLCLLDSDYELCKEKFIQGLEQPSTLPALIQRYTDAGFKGGWQRNPYWSECTAGSDPKVRGASYNRAHFACTTQDGSAGYQVLPYSTNGDTTHGEYADEDFADQVSQPFGYFLPVHHVYGKGDEGYNIGNSEKIIVPTVYVLVDGAVLVATNVPSIHLPAGYNSHDVIINNYDSDTYTTVEEVYKELLQATDDLDSIKVKSSSSISSYWSSTTKKLIIFKAEKKYTIVTDYLVNDSGVYLGKHSGKRETITIEPRDDGYVKVDQQPVVDKDKKDKEIADKLLARWNTAYQSHYAYSDIVETGQVQWSFKFKDGSLALFDTIVQADLEGDEAQPLSYFEDFVGKKHLASASFSSPHSGLNVSDVIKFENGLYWSFADDEGVYIDDLDLGVFTSVIKELYYFAHIPWTDLAELNDHTKNYWQKEVYGLHLNPDYDFGSIKRTDAATDYYLSFYGQINDAGFYDFGVFSYFNPDGDTTIPQTRQTRFFDSSTEGGGNRFYDAQGNFVVDNVISVTSHLGNWVTALAFYHYESAENTFKTQMVTTQKSDYTSDCLRYVLGESSAPCPHVVGLTP